jgi:hypothetical protein
MWSPTLFEGGISQGCERVVCAAVFDLDGPPAGSLDALDAAQETEGLGFILYSTHAHKPEIERESGIRPAHVGLRLVLFLSREVLPSEWSGLWKEIVRRYQLPADDTCKDPTRRYFVPTVQPGATHILEFQEGKTLDVDALLASIPREQLRETPPPAPVSVVTRKPPDTSFDLEVVRRELRTWGSGDPHKDQRARAIAKGEPWASAGRRDTELMGLVGQIVGRFPRIPVEALELLITESAVATAARDGDDPTAHWLERAGVMLERARPDAEEFEARIEGRREAARKLQERMAARVRRKREAAAVPSADIPERAVVEGVPEIHIGVNLEEMVNAAEEALGKDDRVFCAAGRLVRLVRGGGQALSFIRAGDEDAPRIHPLGAQLMTWLATDARWLSPKGKPAVPPGVVVAALSDHLVWPHIARLEGFAESPVFRADGTLITAAGYDAPTGLYVVDATGAEETPAHPTRDDVLQARDLLLDVVADFPFETAEGRSAWLAALLTPFVRHALEAPGLTPLFMIDANVAGAGKTKLVDVTALVATGRPVAKMSNTTDDEEMRKRLLAIALAGKPIVTIDNVSGTLGSPPLDAALTAGVVEDRKLGETQMVCAPLRCTWFATGNNLQLAYDLSRRTLPIRLTSPLEHPENRDGFKHPSLERWVRENRGRLVGAALTVLRAWFQAGMPRHGAKPFGSFEAWQNVVCACVAWMDLPWPECARRPELYAPTSRELETEALDYFETVTAGEWVTVSEFLSKITNKSHPGKNALQELCGTNGQISASALGKLFVRHVDKNVGGKFMRRRTRLKLSEWARLPGKERES